MLCKHEVVGSIPSGSTKGVRPGFARPLSVSSTSSLVDGFGVFIRHREEKVRSIAVEAAPRWVSSSRDDGFSRAELVNV